MKVIVFSLVIILVSTGARGGLREIEAETDLDRGIALILGDQFELAAEFAESGRWIVHLTPADADEIARARAEFARLGLAGRVHVSPLSGDGHLPHPDRFVNLVVADLDAVPNKASVRKEIGRVLAVRAASYLWEGGKWSSERETADHEIDGWFSRWYDASGNAVSKDKIAGFPRAVQWQHGPAMEDGTADGKIMRVADGRIV